MLRLASLVLALLAVAAIPAVGSDAQQPSPHPVRAIVANVVRETDPAPPDRPTPPPPGPGYCQPPGGPDGGPPPSPPNSVIGLFTISGQPAPANTLIALTFNGLPGPYAYTRDAGGYRIDYAAGGQGQVPPCINEVGAQMGILVNGVVYPTGVAVGATNGPLLRFDLHIP